MKTFRDCIFLAALGIAFFAGAVASAYTVASSPHDIRSRGGIDADQRKSNAECVFCHAPDGAPYALPTWGGPNARFSRTSPPNIGPSGSSRVCLSCHDGVLGSSSLHAAHHPYSIAPETGAEPQPPARYEDGRVECISCHDPHAVNRPGFLRAGPRKLCASCHELDGFAGAAHDYTELHPPVSASYSCGNCHAVHEAPESAFLLKSAVETLCFTCHRAGFGGERVNGGPADIMSLMSDDAYGFFDTHTGTNRWVNAAHDVTGPAREKSGARLGCINCHGPHRAVKDDPATLNVVESLVDPDDISRPFTLKGEPTHYRGNDPAWRKAYAIDHFCLTCHDGGMPNLVDRPGLDVRGPSTMGAELINIESVFDRMMHTSQYKVPCIVCHDPHGGNPYLLNGRISWVDAPFATGDAPQSSYRADVSVPRNPLRFEICFASCHRDDAGHQLERSNCQQCHNHRLNM